MNETVTGEALAHVHRSQKHRPTRGATSEPIQATMIYRKEAQKPSDPFSFSVRRVTGDRTDSRRAGGKDKEKQAK